MALPLAALTIQVSPPASQAARPVPEKGEPTRSSFDPDDGKDADLQSPEAEREEPEGKALTAPETPQVLPAAKPRLSIPTITLAASPDYPATDAPLADEVAGPIPVDISAEFVDILQAGDMPVEETGPEVVKAEVVAVPIALPPGEPTETEASPSVEMSPLQATSPEIADDIEVPTNRESAPEVRMATRERAPEAIPVPPGPDTRWPTVDPRETPTEGPDKDIQPQAGHDPEAPAETAPPSLPDAKSQFEAKQGQPTRLEAPQAHRPEAVQPEAQSQVRPAEHVESRTVEMHTDRPQIVAQKLPAPIQIAQQIIASVQRGMDGTIDIRLDPPELGRVTVSLHHSDGVSTAVVSAERPDVIDLMRRNEAMLARELRDAGFSNISFSFTRDQSGGSDRRHKSQESFATALHGRNATADRVFSRQTGTPINLESLDIRL